MTADSKDERAIDALLEENRRFDPPESFVHKARVSDKSRHVRDAAVLALALLGDAGQKPFLRELARDPDAPRHVRGFAVLGLGDLGDIETLEAILLDKKPKLRGSTSQCAGASRTSCSPAGALNETRSIDTQSFSVS